MSVPESQAVLDGPAAADKPLFRLLAMHRAARIEPASDPSTDIASDMPVFDFVSPEVAEKLKSLCTNLRADRALRLLQTMHTRPECSVFAAFLWQPICRAVLCGQEIHDFWSALGNFKRMYQAVSHAHDESENTVTFFDHTISPGGLTRVLICTTERGVIRHPREDLTFAAPAPPPAQLPNVPIRTRVVRGYLDAMLADITPNYAGILFLPMSPGTAGSPPLFDAFFFENTKRAPGGAAVLWVFRFAAPVFEKRDGKGEGSDSDVDMAPLATLIANAKNADYEMAVRYVLLAPQCEHFAVGWRLPKALTDSELWSASGAEVYVQYIEVDDGWSHGLLLADAYVPVSMSSSSTGL